MDFKFQTWRERKQQKFNKDAIMLTKAGKTFNVYQAIQEAREDTEIYPTLEKYGCIDRMMLDHKGVYDDFSKYKGLRELKDQQIMAQNMFDSLPLETKRYFNNDIHTFMREGEAYCKKLVDRDIKLKAETDEINNKLSKPTIEVKPVIKGEVNNG